MRRDEILAIIVALALGCGGRNAGRSVDGGGTGSSSDVGASSGGEGGARDSSASSGGSASDAGEECSATSMCDGACVDLQGDPNNCGACGTICSGTNSFCESGACTAGPPSCQPGGNVGLTNCGASGESCCTSLQVAGGTYYRTYTNTGSGPTGEADPASVSGFRLDKYLVTVGRFRQFVSAWNGGAGYVPPAGSGKHTHVNGGRGLSLVVGSGVVYEPGWVASDDSNIAPTTTNLACMTGYPTWTPAVGGNEQYPVDCVTWAEAYAFCIWDGGFLPSEAEWEYAAGGGSLQREYPWGTMDPGMGNGYAIYRCNYSDRGTCGIAPVGTALQGAGRWGQLDLAGNLNEWNLDYTGKYVNPCTDCAFVTEPFPPARVIRGGDFYLGVSALLPSYRDAFGPDQRQATNGFRCARTP